MDVLKISKIIEKKIEELDLDFDGAGACDCVCFEVEKNKITLWDDWHKETFYSLDEALKALDNW